MCPLNRWVVVVSLKGNFRRFSICIAGRNKNACGWLPMLSVSLGRRSAQIDARFPWRCSCPAVNQSSWEISGLKFVCLRTRGEKMLCGRHFVCVATLRFIQGYKYIYLFPCIWLYFIVFPEQNNIQTKRTINNIAVHWQRYSGRWYGRRTVGGR